MEEILYLEPDEEITSVIDKIKQSKVQRLGLVVPKEATLLQSVVNLRLLSREATSLGKEIALITSDKIGRNLAAKVGLPVFESVKSEQPIFQPPPPPLGQEEVIELGSSANLPQKEERPPRGIQVHHFQEKIRPQKQVTINQPRPWSQPKIKINREADGKNWRKVIWPLVSIVVILILIGAFLVLPKVTVKLKVQAENFNKNTDVKVSGTQATTLESKTFSGRLIDISKEKEEKFKTTGQKNLGGKASGTITLYNYLDNNNHNFSAGTKLSSSSKTFVLKSNVTIPGAGVQSGKAVPGTVSADIEAEEAGEEYNVKPGRFTIVGLDSSQQEFIYGQSNKEMSGGFSKVAQVVSQSDYDSAKAKITGELDEALKKDLQSQAAGAEILDNAIQIDLTSENSSAKVDEEAQDFTLKIQERLREIVFSRSDFDQFVIDIFQEQIPSTQMISLGVEGFIEPQLKDKNYDQELLTFDVKISAKVSAKIDTEQVKDNILGKNRQEAVNYLNNLNGFSGADFQYFPSWWPIKRIPNFRRNLSVSLDYLEPVKNQPSPSPANSAEVSQ